MSNNLKTKFVNLKKKNCTGCTSSNLSIKCILPKIKVFFMRKKNFELNLLQSQEFAFVFPLLSTK